MKKYKNPTKLPISSLISSHKKSSFLCFHKRVYFKIFTFLMYIKRPRMTTLLLSSSSLEEEKEAKKKCLKRKRFFNYIKSTHRDIHTHSPRLHIFRLFIVFMGGCAEILMTQFILHVFLESFALKRH